MATTRTFILTNSPYILDQIALASFVPNIKQPHQDAERPYMAQAADYDIQLAEAFDMLRKTSYESHLTAIVSKLASIIASCEKGNSVRIAAQKSHIYSLRQPSKLFRGGSRTANYTRWSHDSSWGYRNFTDASLTMGTQRGTELGADMKVPVGAMVGDLVGLSDVGAGTGQAHKQSDEGGMTSQGERNYACKMSTTKGLHYLHGATTG